MPITTLTFSVKMKKRFWLMPAMRVMQLAGRVGILKEKHCVSVAQFLASKGVRVITESRPS